MMKLWGCHRQLFHNNRHLRKLCKQYTQFVKTEKSNFSTISVEDSGINAIGILYILTSHLYALNISALVFEEMEVFII